MKCNVFQVKKYSPVANKKVTVAFIAKEDDSGYEHRFEYNDNLFIKGASYVAESHVIRDTSIDTVKERLTTLSK